MGFDVHLDDLRALQNAANSMVSSALVALEGARAAATLVGGIQDFSGAAATSAKMYFNNVHKPLAESLITLLTQYVEKLMEYRDEMQQQDSDGHAVFNEKFMDAILKKTGQDGKRFAELDAAISEIVVSIADILSFHGPTNSAEITEGFADLGTSNTSVQDKIGRTEHKHLHDLDHVKDMISTINSLMDQLPATGGQVTNWKGGAAFVASANFSTMIRLGREFTNEQREHAKTIDQITVRDKERNTVLKAEEQVQSGWQKIAFGVLGIIGGAVGIVYTDGATIPLVLSGASVIFGSSDTIEGIQDVHNGNAGKTDVKSVNPIADTVFGGNMTLYHTVEGFVYLADSTASIASKGVRFSDIWAAARTGSESVKGVEGVGALGLESATRAPDFAQGPVHIVDRTTQYTPLRKSGYPMSAGFEHILDGHFDRELANSRSVFDISPKRLKELLRSSKASSAPAFESHIPGSYVRAFDAGEVVGRASLKDGGRPTNWIRVFSDAGGNVINAYPVPKP